MKRASRPKPLRHDGLLRLVRERTHLRRRPHEDQVSHEGSAPEQAISACAGPNTVQGIGIDVSADQPNTNWVQVGSAAANASRLASLKRGSAARVE
jgi:hypothetical protein